MGSMEVMTDETKDCRNKISEQDEESVEELERKHFQRIVNVFRTYKFVFCLKTFWKKTKLLTPELISNYLSYVLQHSVVNFFKTLSPLSAKKKKKKKESDKYTVALF